jgi:hypothetical protein
MGSCGEWLIHRVVELTWTGERAATTDLDFAVDIDCSGQSSSGRRDIRLTIGYLGTAELAASIRFRVRLAERCDRPWWLVPGVFYGENRPEGCTRIYPRFGADDPAGMVSSHWEFRADRCATPAVFGWAERSGVGVVAGETSALGMTGVGFAYEDRTVWVHLGFPFREEPVSYDGSDRPRPPEVTSYRWRPGERVVLELALYELPGDRHAYATVLREEHERRRAESPLNPWVDIATAAGLAADGLLRWHYDPEPGVLLETVGFDRGVTGQDGLPVNRQAMHVGWVSGIPWAYALLAHGRRVGREDCVAAGRRVIDFCCANLSPSGTFWGVWYRDRGWAQSWSPVRHSLHARTLGEATLFLVRALELVDEPRWTSAVRSNVDAVVARQRRDGNLGSAHHALTGEVLSWAGNAGLAWVSALAEIGDAAYVSAAERAGEYYARFVTGEFLHGAPEDVDLAPSSEDGYLAVQAYAALYRRTGAARWLDLARRAVDWMLTFRYSYNTRFPPGTILDTYNFATRGADNASPANQHLHSYGLICTAELAELSRACGDPYYRERAEESLACFRQFIARFDGDFNAYRGMVSERYYQTACFQPKGMLLTLSHAWSVGVLLLACEQTLG